MSSIETREITFRRLAALMTDSWRTLALCCGATLLLALVSLLVLRPTYTVSMRVTAIPDQNASNPMSALGAAAGLGILRNAGHASDEFLRYQGALTTVELGGRLLKYPTLVNKMFPNSWDAERHVYRPHRRLLGPIYALLGQPSTVPVTAAGVASYLSSSVKTNQPQDDPNVLSITMSSPDPAFAKSLLAAVHFEATEMLRVSASQRADNMINYLRQRLTTLTVQDYRQSLLKLMEQEENQRLLSEPGVAYAAEVVDPPYASDMPTFPKPALFLIVAVVVGFAFGFVLVVLLDAFGISARDPLRVLFERTALRGRPACDDPVL